MGSSSRDRRGAKAPQERLPSVSGLQPPIRTCVGCGRKASQRTLLRIAAHEGVSPAVDGSYCAPGRGAYLCRSLVCVEKAFRRQALERSLKFKGSIPATIKEEIRQVIQTNGDNQIGVSR